jgi:hypothetical protein
VKTIMQTSRNGTVLIVVAGVSALLASLALTFLVRMRGDVEESEQLIRYAQAKLMLAAACNYVQEASRMGWSPYSVNPLKDPVSRRPPRISPDSATSSYHEEAFGWIDVRDGSTGPKNRRGQGTPDVDPANVWFSPAAEHDRRRPGGTRPGWPEVGSIARCPMYGMVRPPYAVQLTAAYNPMSTTSADPNVFCYPLLINPDPQPVVANGWRGAASAAAVSGTNYAQFEAGDHTPLARTTGRSWFRVLRDGPATFVLTCGGGASMGFRDWQEVEDLNQTALFGGDQQTFETAATSEVRLWYRIEWSAAVMETTYHNLEHEIIRNIEHYESWPANSSQSWVFSRRTQTWAKNPVGTIRWIQRLVTAPTYW